MSVPVIWRNVLLAGALCAVACQAVAQPQAWPAKPVKLVVGYPPGGGADTVARLLAERLGRSLAQQVIVENRAGASGAIGALSVARAEPDGYTMLVAAISEISIAPATVKALPYDPVKELKPVVVVGKWPYVLIASPSFAPNTLAELVAYAKANPGKASFSSFGNNTINHLAGEMFKLAAGIDAVHVPYKGSGPAIIDIMGGQIQFAFDSPAVTLNLVKAGKLKALAVTGAQRLPNANTIPTTAEAGLPGFLMSAWVGVLAPARTPQSIVDRVNSDTVTALNSAEFRAALDARSILPGGGTPEEFGRQIAAEIAEWRQVAARIGITPE